MYTGHDETLNNRTNINEMFNLQTSCKLLKYKLMSYQDYLNESILNKYTGISLSYDVTMTTIGIRLTYKYVLVSVCMHSTRMSCCRIMKHVYCYGNFQWKYYCIFIMIIDHVCLQYM